MRNILLIAATFMFGSPLLAQRSVNIAEGQVTMVDGIEIGYTITNETTREAKGEEFSRFQLNFFAQNKSNCSLLFPLQRGQNNGDGPLKYAQFNIVNANGKRFTSRSATLFARNVFLPVQVQEKDADGKTVNRLRDLLAGHGIKQGETLTSSATVLVPKGQRPVVNVVVDQQARF